ncbi:MAG: tail fiber domain-containing protein [Chitinophagaceae bacterium]
MKYIFCFLCCSFHLFINAQVGNVGIGTPNPLARLHVTDSSVLFSATGIASASPYIPMSGAGRRMMWYAGKAAIRAGYVDGSQWNDVNIGNYSIALGSNTIASGNASVAIGGGTSATGDFSTAMGLGTIASFFSSTAIGNSTTANALFSTAMGSNTTASGVGSTAMGQSTTASGDYATVMGQSSVASGYTSVAIGQSCNATNNNAIAIGYQVTSGNHSIAMGNNVNTGSKTGCFVFGDFTPFSTIVNDADNQMMMRFGGGYKLFTDPSQPAAIKILSDGTVGISSNNPLGRLHVVTNSSDGSVSSWSTGQLVVGQEGNAGGIGLSYSTATNTGYISSLSPNTFWRDIAVRSQNTIFFSATTEVMRLSAGGNLGIGNNNPTHKLSITAGTDAAPLTITGGNATDINGMIALAPGRNMTAIDEYVLMSGASGTQGSIAGNGSGGVSYNTTSDKRLKKDIHISQFGLQQLMKIDVADYKYKNDEHQVLQTGFIAQQLYAIFPQAVTVGGIDANKNPWQIDYSKLTPLLVKAVQELKMKNDISLKQNEELQKNITAMNNEIKELKQQSSNIAALEIRLKQLEMPGQQQYIKSDLSKK